MPSVDSHLLSIFMTPPRVTRSASTAGPGSVYAAASPAKKAATAKATTKASAAPLAPPTKAESSSASASLASTAAGADAGSPPPIPDEPWLRALLSTRFYGPCPMHPDQRKNERNLFCLCHATKLCLHCMENKSSSCSPSHPPHSPAAAPVGHPPVTSTSVSPSSTTSTTTHPIPNYVSSSSDSLSASTALSSQDTSGSSSTQNDSEHNPDNSQYVGKEEQEQHTSSCTVLHVTRYMYHDVLLTAELTKHLDISAIQPYVNNGHRVMYIDRRAQPLSPAAPNAKTCVMCARTVQDPYMFCCMYCRLSHQGHPAAPDDLSLPDTRRLALPIKGNSGHENEREGERAREKKGQKKPQLKATGKTVTRPTASAIAQEVQQKSQLNAGGDRDGKSDGDCGTQEGSAASAEKRTESNATGSETGTGTEWGLELGLYWGVKPQLRSSTIASSIEHYALSETKNNSARPSLNKKPNIKNHSKKPTSVRCPMTGQFKATATTVTATTVTATVAAPDSRKNAQADSSTTAMDTAEGGGETSSNLYLGDAPTSAAATPPNKRMGSGGVNADVESKSSEEGTWRKRRRKGTPVRSLLCGYNGSLMTE